MSEGGHMTDVDYQEPHPDAERLAVRDDTQRAGERVVAGWDFDDTDALIHAFEDVGLRLVRWP